MIRCEFLGIPYLVTHPGAFTTSTEADGIARVIAALDQVHARTPGLKVKTLLETTAGQGSCLGCKFEQLGQMIRGVADRRRLGVCVDTCHVHAAGYPLDTLKHFEQTFQELDQPWV